MYEYREVNEQITGLTVGYVTSPKVPEILYSCYSGNIKSICEKKSAKKLGVATEEDLGGDAGASRAAAAARL